MTDSLFTTPAETSRAAEIAARVTAGSVRERIFDFIKSRGTYGATDEEMQREMRLNPSTQRPRRIELQRAERIVNSGETRRTRSGRRAVVWVVQP